MTRHITFLRWWLLVMLIFVGSIFANHFGLFQEIYNKDISKLSVVIVSGFLYMSTWCGIKTFQLSRAIKIGDYETIKKIEKHEDIGWFASGVFTRLGMLGTIAGIICALYGFYDINVADLQSMQNLINQMVLGMCTALYTTGVGLTCSLLLDFQYLNLNIGREDWEE